MLWRVGTSSNHNCILQSLRTDRNWHLKLPRKKGQKMRAQNFETMWIQIARFLIVHRVSILFLELNRVKRKKNSYMLAVAVPFEKAIVVIELFWEWIEYIDTGWMANLPHIKVILVARFCITMCSTHTLYTLIQQHCTKWSLKKFKLTHFDTLKWREKYTVYYFFPCFDWLKESIVIHTLLISILCWRHLSKLIIASMWWCWRHSMHTKFKRFPS